MLTIEEGELTTGWLAQLNGAASFRVNAEAKGISGHEVGRSETVGVQETTFLWHPQVFGHGLESPTDRVGLRA